MRSALRTAVQQDTQIDAPVLEMLRKWLGEDDEALQLGRVGGFVVPWLRGEWLELPEMEVEVILQSLGLNMEPVSVGKIPGRQVIMLLW